MQKNDPEQIQNSNRDIGDLKGMKINKNEKCL